MSIENAAATACSVTSSCVGPTPPDVNRRSKRDDSARTLSLMSSGTSGTTSMRRNDTPSSRSSRIRKRAFSSSTLPDSSSLPMSRMAAVESGGICGDIKRNL